MARFGVTGKVNERETIGQNHSPGLPSLPISCLMGFGQTCQQSWQRRDILLLGSGNPSEVCSLPPFVDQVLDSYLGCPQSSSHILHLTILILQLMTFAVWNFNRILGYLKLFFKNREIWKLCLRLPYLIYHTDSLAMYAFLLLL